MSSLVAAGIGVVVGVLVGMAVMRARRPQPGSGGKPTRPEDSGGLVPGWLDILSEVRSIAILVDRNDAVVARSESAVRQGLVRDRGVSSRSLLALVREVREHGESRDADLDLRRTEGSAGVLAVRVRLAPLAGGFVVALLDDYSTTRRIDEARRDFVVNVSHELKTPVGAISLLCEAIVDAKDDPEAIDRFAKRIQSESGRLTRLVNDITDFSRLQLANGLEDADLVDVEHCVNEAVDRVAYSAASRSIEIAVRCSPGLLVYGHRDLMVTAIVNLVTNAINYSDEGSRVAIGTRRHDGTVEIVVSDQGIGIPLAEQARIFERFYRVDPARSRATGGTGLGLSIVKHICANHGGAVEVWSETGQGSTFTIRLPIADPAVGAADQPTKGTLTP